MQACGRIDRGHGLQDLDIHLLKPARFHTDPNSIMPLAQDLVEEEAVDPLPEWIQYKYRIAHPILRFLPSKLAEFIGENYSDILGIPPKRDRSKWNVQELNAILMNNLVMPRHGRGHLQTFGRIQWECDLFNGRPSARCYPFDLDEHRFRGQNPQVQHAWDITCDIICDVHYDVDKITMC